MDLRQPGSTSILSLPERLDSVTCPEVESALKPLIAANPHQLICDCTPMKYISSTGLRVLLQAAKNLKRSGGRLVLVCSKSSYVYEIFELTKITIGIPIYETVDEAKAGKT